jgi:ribonuclease HI
MVGSKNNVQSNYIEVFFYPTLFQICVLRTDSKVVSSQIEKQCITREPKLEKYLALVRRIENYFKGFIVEYIERNKNTEVDELAMAGAQNTPMPTDNSFKQLKMHQ